MITNEDERVGHTKWTKTSGEGDLGSLVHDTIIKLSSEKQRAKRSAT
jgi:hypothetical protein